MSLLGYQTPIMQNLCHSYYNFVFFGEGPSLDFSTFLGDFLKYAKSVPEVGFSCCLDLKVNFQGNISFCVQKLALLFYQSLSGITHRIYKVCPNKKNLSCLKCQLSKSLVIK